MPAQPERELSAEHHVWNESDDAQAAPFDRFSVVFLRELRWREPPRERVRLGAALIIAILFHVLLIVLLRLEMRPRYIAPLVTTTHEPAIDVTLYEAPPQQQAAPAVPEINLPPLRTREVSPRRVRIEPRAPNAITATIGETQPSAPRLYGRQGQALLPPSSSVAATPDYATPVPQPPSLMKHGTPLPYHSTQFNKDWAPDHESLGAKAFRKAVDATTAEKTVRLPGGMKIKCVASPLMLAFGCGPNPPPPPPKNDNDIRLSMPPAQSLTGKKVTVPATPSTSALPAKEATKAPPAASSNGQ